MTILDISEMNSTASVTAGKRHRIELDHVISHSFQHPISFIIQLHITFGVDTAPLNFKKQDWNS
jgi:hypothetical protein